MLRKHTLIGKVTQDIHSHIAEYSLLLISSGLFVTFLAIFRAQPRKQYIVTTIFVLYYITWGIIHHIRDQSLHLKIILEYIAIGAIAGMLMRGLLF